MALKKPALITVDTANGALEYWPIQPGGSDSPRVFSKSLGLAGADALVANGNLLAIASYTPAEVVKYDVKTKNSKTLNDPDGNPIDLAIDKHGTLYVLNRANVVVFRRGSSQPSELICPTVDLGVAIAVDNEGDVFINGYGGSGFIGVVEFPAGFTKCITLHLRAERGYAAGIGVDPKTDSLIVVDNPDFCAGGLEGRMIIYPKPYEQRTSRRRNLHATYCANNFRLNATSSRIFVQDATVSDGFPVIDQETYPGAKFEGQYQVGPSASAYFGGLTTIPNTLPN